MALPWKGTTNLGRADAFIYTRPQSQWGGANAASPCNGMEVAGSPSSDDHRQPTRDEKRAKIALISSCQSIGPSGRTNDSLPLSREVRLAGDDLTARQRRTPAKRGIIRCKRRSSVYICQQPREREKEEETKLVLSFSDCSSPIYALLGGTEWGRRKRLTEMDGLVDLPRRHIPPISLLSSLFPAFGKINIFKKFVLSE